MKTISNLLFAAAAASVMSTPLFAQDAAMTDMSTMTCADLMKMDETGMMSAASHAEMMMQMNAMSDADKTAMDGKSTTDMTNMTDEQKSANRMTMMQTEMQTKMDAMTDDEKAAQMKTTQDMMTKMETACAGKDTMTVDEVMKSSM
ncbi:MAG: hypothetical protein H7245_23545 [Candidatus Saccharibacteria bacterium]|nr:hypothetical protein [Pseudorhodobacter sp.]